MDTMDTVISTGTPPLSTPTAASRLNGAPARGWTVVVPVKGGPEAKSRLHHPERLALSAAFAHDTVTAALGCPAVVRVVVVTADPSIRRAHDRLGADTVAQLGDGLAGALRTGISVVSRAGTTALLLGDLPALRAEDLTLTLADCEALLSRGAPQVTVPDADGTGTVMLAAADPGSLRPRFGPGSAQAHAVEAAVLASAPARLRRDVDTDRHLVEAVALGVGTATAAVLAGGVAVGVAAPQPRSTIAPSEASLSPKCS